MDFSRKAELRICGSKKDVQVSQYNLFPSFVQQLESEKGSKLNRKVMLKDMRSFKAKVRNVETG